MRHDQTRCRRCGKKLHTDEWGRWVDGELWLTCPGGQPHDPVRP